MIQHDKCSSCGHTRVVWQLGEQRPSVWGRKVHVHRGGDVSPGSERERGGKAEQMSSPAESELGLRCL